MGTSTVTTTQMVVAGYDPEVAAAHGYRIVTNADGTQASVPASLPLGSSGGMTVNATVPGTCGTSSVTILDAGGGQAAVGTGFNLTSGAISYGWSVTVFGGAGTYTKPFGGTLLNRKSWTGSFTWTVPASGTYIAAVSTSSWALLANGTICTSGGPSEAEWISR